MNAECRTYSNIALSAFCAAKAPLDRIDLLGPIPALAEHGDL